MIPPSRLLPFLALTTITACARFDPEAAARAAASASANPGTPAADPSLPAGVLLVDLIPAVEPLALDKPATLSIGSSRATWAPDGPARFERLPGAARHDILVSGPYLVEPTSFTLPTSREGARIAVKVLPFGPLPPPPIVYGDTLPMTPEKVLELDLTRPDTIGLRWRQLSATIAMSDLPRSGPDLAERFRREWGYHGGHRDPADDKADSAILRAEPTTTVASISPVLTALLSVRRERTAHPGIEVPVFAVAIAPPEPKKKALLDDEIGPLDVVARSTDRGAAIAGAVGPMREALAKCGAAACSPALRARLLLHLGEALSAAGKRDDAEIAFLDARTVDPAVALEPSATSDSAAIFAAAGKRRLPSVRAGAPSVSGRLAIEAIQAVVKAREGLVRLCWAEALRNNPNLQGRIAIRLVIGNDGETSNLANGGSDLPDAGTIACVRDTFGGLTFPRPEGGIVTVVYPIMFTPRGS